LPQVGVTHSYSTARSEKQTLGKPQNNFQHQLFIRLEIIVFSAIMSHWNGMDGFILCRHSGERKTACRSSHEQHQLKKYFI
jgi:hypothetical protein